MKRQVLSILILLCTALSVFAQGSQTLKIALADSADDSAIGFATVSLTPDGAEKPSKYLLTNDKGEARFEGLKKGVYTVRAELMGYKTYEGKVTVSDKPVDLGTVKLDADTQLLEAATVSAVGNPITVKKDTVEYNASSFRVTDNDMLEDLLKKLPGIEVSSDGKVTANGQEIKKITIDGKTFFLDDPSLASKNIPAKIVNKVKVVEKKSDQAMFTGIDDGEEETIIDLSIRPGMMKGWFGNVMGGGGHDIQYAGMGQPARWQGAAMVGRFTDKSQISLLLNANNTNNRGFNDMAGSMMGQMRGGGRGMGRGQGGFGGDNGITTSWMGGLNGAFSLCDGDMDLGANYLYNGSRRLLVEQSLKDTYLDDGSILRYTDGGPYTLSGRYDGGKDKYGINNTLTQGHRFGLRLEHKFSEKSSILFEPQVNFGGGSFNEYSDNETFRINDTGTTRVNGGFTNTDGRNRNWSTSGFLLYRQRLNKPGRTISVMSRYSFSGNGMNGYNQSFSESDERSSVTNQYYDTKSNSYSANARASYTEPLAEKLFLEAYASYGWSLSESRKNTYDSGISDAEKALWFSSSRTGEYALFNPVLAFGELDPDNKNEEYSNAISNTHQNIQGGANIQWQTDKLRLQVGASYQPSITDNLTNGKTYHSVVHNWSPQAMVGWDISDNSNLRVFYRGRSAQPSTSQLMPVPDNSNPLNLSFGNPYLTPYFTHNIRGRYGFTNKKTFFSVNCNLRAGIVQDGIVNATWYDKSGVQYSMPVNGPVSGNVNAGFFLNAPFGQSGFSVSNMFNAGFNSSYTYVGRSEKSDEFTEKYYTPVAPDFDYEKLHKDKGLIDKYFIRNTTSALNVMERLKATYRNDFVEVSASARTFVNKAWYTMEGINQKATWNNQASCEMIWTIPGGFGINMNYNYNWYNGYTNQQPDEHILNVEISQLLFKKMFTLAIKGYDLFNQSKNLNVTDNANFHQEIRNNTLGRYVILSLTYRFGNFNNARKQMESSSRRGGPMGGRGPMGGGPM